MSVISRAAGRLLGARIDPPVGDPLPNGAAEVTFREGRLIPWIGGVLAGMSGPATAVTLGRTIVVARGARLSRELLAHELTHVRQWRADVLFPIRYTVAMLRHGYLDNPYEIEARLAARDLAAPPSDARIT